jgi:hypothetical protein
MLTLACPKTGAKTSARHQKKIRFTVLLSEETFQKLQLLEGFRQKLVSGHCKRTGEGELEPQIRF